MPNGLIQHNNGRINMMLESAARHIALDNDIVAGNALIYAGVLMDNKEFEAFGETVKSHRYNSEITLKAARSMEAIGNPRMSVLLDNIELLTSRGASMSYWGRTVLEHHINDYVREWTPMRKLS